MGTSVKLRLAAMCPYIRMINRYTRIKCPVFKGFVCGIVHSKQDQIKILCVIEANGLEENGWIRIMFYFTFLRCKHWSKIRFFPRL